MSHRKRDINKNPRSKSQSFNSNGQPPVHNWELASQLLGMRDEALQIARLEHISPLDFWEFVRPLDTADSVWGSLDEETMLAMPSEDRIVFLSRYIPACITEMAKASGIIEVFTRSGMVSFRPSNAPIMHSKDAYADEHFYNMPALAPISHLVPGFSGTFLGLLQGRLESLLKSRNLLSIVIRDEADLNNRILRAQSQISAERLYGETKVAAAEYFRIAGDENNPAVVTVIATEVAPFLFIWLISLNVIDDMIIALLHGKPMLKVVEGDEKGDDSNFMATEDGIDAGLFRIEKDED